MANVKFLFGTKAQWLALESPRNEAALYFLTDTRELYKGDYLYNDGLRVVDSYANLPEFGVAADGILYYTKDTKCGYVLADTRDAWLQVIYAPVTDISAVASEDVNNFVPTVGAVINAINEISGGESATIPIATTETPGKVKASDEVLVATDGTMSIGTIAQSKVADLESALAAKANAEDVYTKKEVNALLMGIVEPTGEVGTYDDLATITDPEVGDVYAVADEGVEYGWNGTEWVVMETVTSEVPVEVENRLTTVEESIVELDNRMSWGAIE